MSNLAELAQSLTARSAIHAEDVLAMRRIVWGDSTVSTEEAEAIMTLNSACALRSPEWIDYFVEVIVDYLVHQQVPQGYVDAAKAEWLMRWIDQDGRVDSLSELELLVKILEVAASVPPALKDYALDQVERAVMTGTGPTRQGSALDGTCINAVEVELLRRIIFAQAGDGAYIVSAAEAERLFRLKDATLGANNAPSWCDLFVRGVGNHLMGHRNYDTLSREDQVRMDAFEADTHVNVAGFFGRMVGIGIKPGFSPAVRAIPDRMADSTAAAVDQAISPAETRWVIEHIRADGKYDRLEKALVEFIRAETAA
jgi:hypothetical protein